MSEALAPEQTDFKEQQPEQAVRVHDDIERPSFPKLDGVLFPIVEANADVVAACPWMGGAEVSLSTALINYPTPMTEENADEVISHVYEFLANQVNPVAEEAVVVEESLPEIPTEQPPVKADDREATKKAETVPVLKKAVEQPIEAETRSEVLAKTVSTPAPEPSPKRRGIDAVADDTMVEPADMIEGDWVVFDRTPKNTALSDHQSQAVDSVLEVPVLLKLSESPDTPEPPVAITKVDDTINLRPPLPEVPRAINDQPVSSVDVVNSQPVVPSRADVDLPRVETLPVHPDVSGELIPEVAQLALPVEVVAEIFVGQADFVDDIVAELPADQVLELAPSRERDALEIEPASEAETGSTDEIQFDAGLVIEIDTEPGPGLNPDLDSDAMSVPVEAVETSDSLEAYEYVEQILDKIAADEGLVEEVDPETLVELQVDDGWADSLAGVGSEQLEEAGVEEAESASLLQEIEQLYDRVPVETEAAPSLKSTNLAGFFAPELQVEDVTADMPEVIDEDVPTTRRRTSAIVSSAVRSWSRVIAIGRSALKFTY